MENRVALIFGGVARERKSRFNYAMAELMGDVRELLQHILSDQFLFENFIPKKETGYDQIMVRIRSRRTRTYGIILFQMEAVIYSINWSSIS